MKRISALLLVAVALYPALSLRAESAPDALSSIKKMVGYIRYSQKKPEYADRALRFVDMDGITRFLLGPYYGKSTPEQRSRFRTLLGEYIKLRAFPQALRYFQKVDISYDTPGVKDSDIWIRSSILYGAQEKIVFTWVVEEREGNYLIRDFLDRNDVSVMKINRDRQIVPLIREKGVEGMLLQFKKVVDSLK